MMTSLYSEQIPVAEITSDWCKFHFPRDSRVIKYVNLTLGFTAPRLASIRARPRQGHMEEPGSSPSLLSFPTRGKIRELRPESSVLCVRS